MDSVDQAPPEPKVAPHMSYFRKVAAGIGFKIEQYYRFSNSKNRCELNLDVSCDRNGGLGDKPAQNLIRVAREFRNKLLEDRYIAEVEIRKSKSALLGYMIRIRIEEPAGSKSARKTRSSGERTDP